MTAYQLLIVDVDGTLAGAGGLVAPGATEALTAVRRQGLSVALSTGRTPPACAMYRRELDLVGPHIYFDGSLVYDSAGDDVILERRADPSALADVLALASERDISAEIYTREGYYVAALTPAIRQHAELQRCTPEMADLRAIVEHEPVVKAELVLTSDAERAAARELAARLAGRLRLSWATAPGLPHLTFVNVVHPEVDKGAAVVALAQHLGVPLERVAVVGDSGNDLPMFEVAGLAIAMGNAPIDVQAAADVVTSRVEAGGLADAIYRHVLNGAS